MGNKEEEIKKIMEAVNKYNPPAHLLEELKNNPRPASFMVRKSRGIKSTELVIDLIIKSVAEQEAITRDDIYLLYWLYKTECETKDLPMSNEYVIAEGWRNITMDKQTFINHWRMQRNAVSWFKGALSSAILEGNLLVLPIIKI